MVSTEAKVARHIDSEVMLHFKHQRAIITSWKDTHMNEPLNASDQSKIIGFGLLLIPAIIFVVGIIPVLFLCFAVLMLYKNQDFSYIETSVKIFTWFAVAICALLFAIGAYNIVYGYDREAGIATLLVSSIPIVYIALIRLLFLNPLIRHRVWVQENGIFSSRRSKEAQASKAQVDIIGSEKLKQYSVADELIKWTQLKEGGHISDEQFEEARKKLMRVD